MNDDRIESIRLKIINDFLKSNPKANISDEVLREIHFSFKLTINADVKDKGFVSIHGDNIYRSLYLTGKFKIDSTLFEEVYHSIVAPCEEIKNTRGISKNNPQRGRKRWKIKDDQIARCYVYYDNYPK